MEFKFWATVNDKQVELKTKSLLSASREAKALGASSCFGFNPATKQNFPVDIR